MKDAPIKQGEMTDLPNGWVRARVGEICEAVNGRAFKPSEWADAGKPIVRIQNLKDPSVKFNYYHGQVDSKFDVNEGDLLFAWSGTPGTSFGAHLWGGPKALLNQHIFNIHFNRSEISPRYFKEVLNQNVSEYVRQAQGGVGLAHITKPKFNDSIILLPPLPEQRRIVAEIETQFTRLDASVSALRRAQANLKRYRASVLKAACEGRLVPTEAELARSEGREYEPAAVLLERILAERRARWESQEKRRGKYKEPSAPDASALPQLPEGWAWATVEQTILGTPQNGLYKHKSEYGDGIPILRIDDYQDFYLRERESLQCLRVTPEELATYGLRQGQLVVNRVNSPSHLGKCLVVPDSLLPAVFESNMMRLATSSVISVSYIAYYLRSFVGRVRLTSNAKWAVNQASINQTDVCSTQVPLPPLAEQHRIVAEVERRLSVVQQAEATVEASLDRAERLRQSILKQGFSGRLVPQDPGDEPASVLLERIRAEREAEAQASAAAKGKSGQRSRKKATV